MGKPLLERGILEENLMQRVEGSGKRSPPGLTHQIKRRNGKPRGCSMYQVLRSLARQTQPAIDSTWFNATIGIVDKSYPSYRHHV